MLRMGGGTISAKTGLLQAGAGHAMNMPITVSTTPYIVTTLGYDSDGNTCPGANRLVRSRVGGISDEKASHETALVVTLLAVHSGPTVTQQ